MRRESSKSQNRKAGHTRTHARTHTHTHTQDDCYTLTANAYARVIMDTVGGHTCKAGMCGCFDLFELMKQPKPISLLLSSLAAQTLPPLPDYISGTSH